jgi:hypothetical protein
MKATIKTSDLARLHADQLDRTAVAQIANFCEHTANRWPGATDLTFEEAEKFAAVCDGLRILLDMQTKD